MRCRGARIRIGGRGGSVPGGRFRPFFLGPVESAIFCASMLDDPPFRLDLN
jgi:hypothetical protein